MAVCDTLLPWLEKVEPGFAIRWKRDQRKPMQGIKSAFNAARKCAGLRKDITVYTIRRTIATELRARGVDGWELAGFLGHSKKGLGITEIYAQYTPGYMKSAARAVDEYFRELEPC